MPGDLRECSPRVTPQIVRPNMRDRFCCSLAILARRCDRREPRARGTSEDTIEDFLLNRIAEKGDVGRRVEQA